VKLETDIALVHKQMFEFKEQMTNDKMKLKRDREIIEISANWQVEKEDLLRALKQLRVEIRGAKQRQQTSSRLTATLREVGQVLFEDQEKYWTILRRWEADFGDVSKSEEVEKLWDSIVSKRMSLAELICANQKKAEELTKRNREIKQMVEKAQKREKHCMDEGKQREGFELEENGLMRKIKAMKIRLAQW
jgi:hypothetical protein